MKYNMYGLVAIEAVLNISDNTSPKEAWQHAATTTLSSESSRQKGCPRDAFLGLCQEGLVKGVKRGKYTNSVLNKQYALNAVQVLMENKNKKHTSKELWQTLNLKKAHNGQMDVVLALWKENYLKK